jgi:glycerophosphoryl diester phosphodiesterase
MRVKKLMLLLPVVLLVASLQLCRTTQEKVEGNDIEYIAHAGGAIDSCVYTNSLEALNLSVEKGYRFIELDFAFTSDSVLVAAHSWEKFNAITGFGHWGDSVPTYDDFKSRKIYGRYTPISAKEANTFLEKTPGIYLVTDKISNPDILRTYFPGLKERMVVEAFSYSHYEQLRSEGYFRVLYSCMADDLTSALLKHMVLNDAYPGYKIEWLALHTTGFDDAMFKILDRYCDFSIALFTVDNLDSIPEGYRERSKMIYTNFILPGKYEP